MLGAKLPTEREQQHTSRLTDVPDDLQVLEDIGQLSRYVVRCTVTA